MNREVFPKKPLGLKGPALVLVVEMARQGGIFVKNRTQSVKEHISDVSKTPKITSWVKSAPEICPRKGRSKCTDGTPQ